MNGPFSTIGGYLLAEKDGSVRRKLALINHHAVRETISYMDVDPQDTSKGGKMAPVIPATELDNRLKQ